ncbi:MAG TPA: hypothetical protein VF147_13740 [Vicinamibacterales bacterium]
MRTLALIAAAAILIAHLLAVGGLAGRPLHYDENEYLHTSWLMAAGQRIYHDFFEDHPPHLGVMLQSVLPGGELRQADVHAWTVRARILCGALGTVAVLALMLFAWRATRSPAAPVVAAAMVVASPQMWSRGIADIRAEAPTLALFWTGVVLMTWSSERTRAQAIRAGVGIGLMLFANLWNPKWPLEGALMGVLYLALLWRMRRDVRSLAASVGAAVAVTAIAIAPILMTTSLSEYVFFNFRLKAEVARDFTSNPWIVSFFERVPVWQSAAPQHRWWWIASAIALAIMALLFRPKTGEPGERRDLQWIAVALCIASLLEVRFVYPYPYLWAQYLVMLAMCASLVYALLAAQHRVVGIVAIALAATFALVRLQPMAASVFRDAPRSWSAYWHAQRALQTSLRESDRVWISPPRHPVAAFDASYYWYNFRESAPSAIRARSRHPEFLPPVAFSDLPPCTLRARYVELGDWMPFLDGVCRCGETAFNAGKLAPTESLGIFEVTNEKRDAPWLRRTRGLWSDLCRRQEVFLRGGQLNITP